MSSPCKEKLVRNFLSKPILITRSSMLPGEGEGRARGREEERERRRERRGRGEGEEEGERERTRSEKKFIFPKLPTSVPETSFPEFNLRGRRRKRGKRRGDGG
jgi:hypothetical protein